VKGKNPRLPPVRQASMDPTRNSNNIEYLNGRAQDEVMQYYEALKRLGVTDIGELHAEGRVDLPLKGPVSERKKILDKIGRFVEKKRTELRVAREGGNRRDQSPSLPALRSIIPLTPDIIDLELNSKQGDEATNEIEYDENERDNDSMKRKKDLNDSLEDALEDIRPPAKTATDELSILRHTVRKQKEELEEQKGRVKYFEQVVERISMKVDKLQKAQKEEAARYNKIIERLEVENKALSEIAIGKEAELVEYRKKLGISGPEETYTQAMNMESEQAREPIGRDLQISQPPSRQLSFIQPAHDTTKEAVTDPSDLKSKEKLAKDILDVVEEMLTSRLGLSGSKRRNRSRSNRHRPSSIGNIVQDGNSVERDQEVNPNFPPPLSSRPQTRRRNRQTYSQTVTLNSRGEENSVPITAQSERSSDRERSRNPAIQPRFQTTTVHPKVVKGGELENNVRKQLRYDGITSSEFGVTKFIDRPDGALIVTIPDRNLREKFEATLKELDYKIADQAYRPFEVRIHALADETMAHTVEDEVNRKFGISPIKVETFPYNRDNAKLRNLQFAIVYCTEELYGKMAATKGININWQWCRIDSQPRAMKCKSCGMLGHLAKFCSKVEVANELKNNLAGRNDCIDCTYQNTINANRKNRKRPVDHARGSPECPTFRSLTKRQIRQWKLSESRERERQQSLGQPSSIAGSPQHNENSCSEMNINQNGGQRTTPQLDMEL